MPTKSYQKYGRDGRTDAFLCGGLGCKYCLAGSYAFEEGKGNRWMTGDSYVDTHVKAFADYIQCDPELAQELYFKHKVSEALDNEQKASIGRELSTLQIVSNNLDRAAKACNCRLSASRLQL